MQFSFCFFVDTVSAKNKKKTSEYDCITTWKENFYLEHENVKKKLHFKFKINRGEREENGEGVGGIVVCLYSSSRYTYNTWQMLLFKKHFEEKQKKKKTAII